MSRRNHRLTKEEQETTIRFDANLVSVSIFTAYPPSMRKLVRSGQRPYKVNKLGSTESGWFFQVPYSQFRWGIKGVRTPKKPMVQAP